MSTDERGMDGTTRDHGAPAREAANGGPAAGAGAGRPGGVAGSGREAAAGEASGATATGGAGDLPGGEEAGTGPGEPAAGKTPGAGGGAGSGSGPVNAQAPGTAAGSPAEPAAVPGAEAGAEAGAVAGEDGRETPAARLAALEAECQRLRQELEAARREAGERLEQLQRLQADFTNYRRRMIQEQARWRQQAVGDFVRELLPVVDNLERALAAGRDGDPLKEGVALVHRQLLDTLRQAGVEPIDAAGQTFDPRLHEAMAREETDRFPDGQVIEVFQRGYLYQGRTLRPALVKVAVAPAAAGSKPAGSDPAGGAGTDGPAAGRGDGAGGTGAPAASSGQDGLEEATRA